MNADVCQFNIVLDVGRQELLASTKTIDVCMFLVLFPDVAESKKNYASMLCNPPVH